MLRKIVRFPVSVLLTTLVAMGGLALAFLFVAGLVLVMLTLIFKMVGFFSRGMKGELPRVSFLKTFAVVRSPGKQLTGYREIKTSSLSDS